MRLRCVNLVSTDPVRLRDFYSLILGMPWTEIVPGRYEIAVCGLSLVFTPTSVRTEVNPDSCGLEFETENVDEIYRRLLAAGVRTEYEPTTYPWKWRAFGLKDPDGNNVDFVQFVGD